MEYGNSEQIQRVIIAQDVMDTLKDVSDAINNPLLGVEINPRGLFCAKTGAPIGNRDENSLFFLVKNCGKKRAIETLLESYGANVSPHWIKTDGRSLDELQALDPIGYAAYCFNLMTSRWYLKPHVANTHSLRMTKERYWALARAYQLLATRGISELGELNILLCRALTFAPDTLHYISRLLGKHARSPDMLALLACTGELPKVLNEAAERALDSIGKADAAIKRTRFEAIPYTVDELAARGPSNIRKQRSSTISKSLAKAQKEYAEIMELFGDKPKRQTFVDAPLASRLQRFTAGASRAEEKLEKDLLDDIGALFERDDRLVEFSDDLDDTDDNEVEIRKLPVTPTREAGAGTNPSAQISTPTPAIIEPIRTMTLSERIALAKAQAAPAKVPSLADRLKSRLGSK